MARFMLMFLGQVVSLLGSNLTSFALGIWVYQTTGEVTKYSLIFFFTWVPNILITPIAGVLVDRWNRRTTLILSDAGAGLGTLIIALLFLTSQLEVWHIYLITMFSSVFGAFQFIALPAAVTLMVDKEQLGRASGLLQFGRAAAQILAPLLAGVLISVIDIGGIILLDFVTFLFATSILTFFVKIPQPKKQVQQAEGQQESFAQEALFGGSYLFARRGLLGLVLFFAATNFYLGIVQILITPLVLSFASVRELGTVLSVGGGGMLVGGILMGLWGGPRHRVAGIMVFSLLQGIVLMIGGWRSDLYLIMGATFVLMLCTPIIAGSSQVIWQRKVSPELQGRVFAARHVVASAATPIAYLLAGPLADGVFEPAMAEGGRLAALAGDAIGIGAGRGIGLLLMTLGALFFLTVAMALTYAPLRRVETELADFSEEETSNEELSSHENSPSATGEDRMTLQHSEESDS